MSREPVAAKKKEASPERGLFSVRENAGLFSPGLRLVVVMVDGVPRLRLDRVLVDPGGSWDIGIEVGACWNQVVFHLVLAGRAGFDLDAAGVDALIRNQVFLGVDRTLRRQIFSGDFVAVVAPLLLGYGSSVADEDDGGVGFLLRVEGYVVEAGFGFIVDAGRTMPVSLELGGSERAEEEALRR